MIEQEKKSPLGLAVKNPMFIDLKINTPLGFEAEKIFEQIKKIDELRDPNHTIRLEINCNAF